MKFTFETEDELEAKQFMAAKNALQALFRIWTGTDDNCNISLEEINNILDQSGINLAKLVP